MAEVTSTIIAASIPFYRPLVRRVAGKSAKGPSQDSYSMRPNRNTFNKHNKLGSRAEIKGGFQEAAADDSSDRAIVSHEPSQIVRHTNIRVEYDDADQGRRDVEAGNMQPGPMYYWPNQPR